jgi:hypothetical protein
MTTIVDSLTVQLGLDVKNFRKPAKDATDDLQKIGSTMGVVSKETEEGTKRMANGVTKLRNEFLTLTAVIAGAVGIEKFIQNTVTGAAASGVMAGKLGLATNEMQAWGRAARDAGSSVEAMNAQLSESVIASTNRRQSGQLPSNIGEIARVGAMYGGGLRLNALSAGGVEWLMERARILQGAPVADRAAVAQTLGISSDVQAFAAQGPAAMMASYRSRLQSASTTDQQAADAQAVVKGVNDFKDALGNVTTSFVRDLLPAMKNFTEYLNSKDASSDYQKYVAQPLGASLAWVMALGGNKTAAQAVMTNNNMPYRGFSDVRLDSAAESAARANGIPVEDYLALKNAGERTPFKNGKWATSSKGARGVMQMLPGTFNEFAHKGEDIDNAIDNINVGARYYAYLYKKYGGNSGAATAAYNGGWRAAGRVLQGQLPPAQETQDYLTRTRAYSISHRSSTSSAETNIGTVNINAPHATNAQGIGNEIRQTPEVWNFAYQANSGQQ